MTTLLPTRPEIRVLQPREILTFTADAASSGRAGVLGDNPGDNVPDVPLSFTALASGATLSFGPHATVKRFLLEALAGQGVTYTQTRPALAHVEIVGDASGLREIVGTGAPTDGTTGAATAGPGSTYTDSTTGQRYVNMGTTAVPAWRAVPTLTGTIGDLCFYVGAGVPVDGTSGTGHGAAGPGSTYTDSTNANLYINGNTKASPTWKLVTRAA